MCSYMRVFTVLGHILGIRIKHMSAVRTTKQIEAIVAGNQMETCLHNGVKL